MYVLGKSIHTNPKLERVILQKRHYIAGCDGSLVFPDIIFLQSNKYHTVK